MRGNSSDYLFVRSVVSVCGFGRTILLGENAESLVYEFRRAGIDAFSMRAHGYQNGVDLDGGIEKIPALMDDGRPDLSQLVDTAVISGRMDEFLLDKVGPLLGRLSVLVRKHLVLRLWPGADGPFGSETNHALLKVWERKSIESGFREDLGHLRVAGFQPSGHYSHPLIVFLEIHPKMNVRGSIGHEKASDQREQEDFELEMSPSDPRTMWCYREASFFVKPKDRIFLLGCRDGESCRALARLTRASNIMGVDPDDKHIKRGRALTGAGEGRIEYVKGDYKAVLGNAESASCDVIVSFQETFFPKDFVDVRQDIERVLVPGGRLILCGLNGEQQALRNPSSDKGTEAKGASPDSYVPPSFILETLGPIGSDFEWENSLCCFKNFFQGMPQGPIEPGGGPGKDVGWFMVAMKNPLDTVEPYTERVFGNVSGTDNLSVQYAKRFEAPWLMHAMINVSWRIRNSSALELLVESVLRRGRWGTNDHSAALCVKAYRILDRVEESTQEAIDFLPMLEKSLSCPDVDSMGLRWRVSLLFVKGKLLQLLGRFQDSMKAFLECANIDVRAFGIHLATKSTEAYYRGGQIALALNRREEALAIWKKGIDCGNQLLDVRLSDILINPDYPNLFNYGDGVREYSLAWDNIARCANGVHLLNESGEPDVRLLSICHQTEYELVTADLHVDRETLGESVKDLIKTRKDLVARTEELVRTRKDLVARTEELVRTRKDLVARTEELVRTRNPVSRLSWKMKKRILSGIKTRWRNWRKPGG